MRSWLRSLAAARLGMARSASAPSASASQVMPRRARCPLFRVMPFPPEFEIRQLVGASTRGRREDHAAYRLPSKPLAAESPPRPSLPLVLVVVLVPPSEPSPLEPEPPSFAVGSAVGTGPD